MLNKEDSPGFFCKTSKSTQLDEQRCRERGRERERERDIVCSSAAGDALLSVVLDWGFLNVGPFPFFQGPSSLG
jgi:hypothetical protein